MKPSARRMIEDMTIRHFVARTQTHYIRTARTFAAFLGQSPDQAEPESAASSR
jgi:integrase/recombinase XerD